VPNLTELKSKNARPPVTEDNLNHYIANSILCQVLNPHNIPDSIQNLSAWMHHEIDKTIDLLDIILFWCRANFHPKMTDVLVRLMRVVMDAGYSLSMAEEDLVFDIFL
jgi:hypothetical protein